MAVTALPSSLVVVETEGKKNLASFRSDLKANLENFDFQQFFLDFILVFVYHHKAQYTIKPVILFLVPAPPSSSSSSSSFIPER